MKIHWNSYKISFDTWMGSIEYIKASTPRMAYIFFAYKRYSNGRGFFVHEVTIEELKTGDK